MGKILVLLWLFCITTPTKAEPLAKFPDWNMVPAQDGWFLLTPPDERKPIMIPASAAGKLEIAAITPEKLYQQFAKPISIKNQDENIWKKDHGFYVQDEKSENGSGISSMTPDDGSEKGNSEDSTSGPMVIGGASSASSVPSAPAQAKSGKSNSTPLRESTSSSASSASNNPAASGSGSPVSGTGASSAFSPFLNEEAAKAKVVIGQKKVLELKSGEVKAPPPPPSCENAKSLGILKEETKNLSFTATNNTCEFGIGDNLARNNGHVTARREQIDSFEIPAKAVICEFSLSSSSSTMRYDDHYLFLFNGYILSSNLTTALRDLPTETILVKSGNAESSVIGKKYDWMKIRGKQGNDGSYCIGEATCQWPATEQQGAVNLQLNSALAKAIAAKSSTGKQEFKYIISGDDNNSDCQHSGLQLKANLKYYVP